MSDFAKDTNVPTNDCISRQAATDALIFESRIVDGHYTEYERIINETIYQYFDVCNDEEETPISDKDKLLLEINKSICNKIKENWG